MAVRSGGGHATARRSGQPAEAAPPADTTPTGPRASGPPSTTAAAAPPVTVAHIDVRFAPGDDVAAAVDAAPAGTVFFFANGTYNATTIKPKDGDTFVGESRNGVVLSGAMPLTTWTRAGSMWAAAGRHDRATAYGQCQPAFPRCGDAEQLFLDDRLLRAVASRKDVRPGTWFFDARGAQVFMGDNPDGHHVELAVQPAVISSNASTVTIAHLTVQRAASPTSSGAIDGRSGAHWLIDDVTVRQNHGTGITLGRDSTARRFSSLDNGMEGIGAGVCCGEHGPDTPGVVFEDGEVAGNNRAGYDPGWGGGGSKFVATKGLVVQRLWVHDNLGNGLWTDIVNSDTVYQDNVVEDNTGIGIFHEISYSAVIRRNVVRRNGFGNKAWLYGAGITVSASAGVEISGNTVEDCYNGITGIMQDRGADHVLQGMVVHDNVVRMSGGLTGVSSSLPGDWYAGKNNVFRDNQYVLNGSAKKVFNYGTSGAGAPLSFEQWQTLGQDVNGSAQLS